VRSSPTAPDDFDLANLIKRCAHHDPSALRSLYESQGALLLGIAYRLVGRDQQVAEEVVQDAFLEVWRHAGRFDSSLGSARGWLVSIVRFRALDRRRAEVRHPLMGCLDDPGIPPTLPPDFVDSATLTRCLGELKDGPRKSIVLAYVEGCSHAEIAGRLKEPLGTVKAWIVRGLTMLKRCFER
jgi:RNA polymerase sigma-70 factor (ECF subfamily)